jgi:selenocysteine lyase/cysteine desulfurase
LESDLTNVRSGGTGTTSEQIRQPQTMPARLESGNMNGPGLAGLNAGVQWLLEQDLGKLHEKAAAQCHALGTALRELSGVRILAPEIGLQNVGIVSFVIDELDAADVAAILDQSFGIQCRAGLHCAPLCHQHLHTDVIGGAVRLSPGPFTTDEQIDGTVDALKQIASSVVT